MPPAIPPSLARYARQIAFAPLGADGQVQLSRSRALVCGCGALGTHLAETLVRAGVGEVTIVDRDFVDTTNLQRQSLFDEDDVARCLPKAVAAAEKLRKINSQVRITPIVADVSSQNIAELCAGRNCLLDGTDNFETRFLLNDAAFKFEIPWVYGGCLGAEGRSMTIVPGETPCLRCLMPEAPAPGTQPTCETAGIVAPAIAITAGWQAMEALKILSGRTSAISRTLMVFDLWDNRFQQVDLRALSELNDCPTCGEVRDYSWLEGRLGSASTVLCGRNAVQVSSPGSGPGTSRSALDLEQLEQQLVSLGTVRRNPFLLRFQVDGYTFTIFPDGRAIIAGTEDVAVAKTLYARYLGA